jgi:hypothetical protein
MMTPEAVLDLPLEENDGGAATVREYLEKLLATLWSEEEGFSGKRPLGDSGWQGFIEHALVKYGCINGTLDEYGDLVNIDDDAAGKLMQDVIRALCAPSRRRA